MSEQNLLATVLKSREAWERIALSNWLDPFTLTSQ